jgi:hypothetical protein
VKRNGAVYMSRKAGGYRVEMIAVMTKSGGDSREVTIESTSFTRKAIGARRRMRRIRRGFGRGDEERAVVLVGLAATKGLRCQFSCRMLICSLRGQAQERPRQRSAYTKRIINYSCRPS